MNQPRDAGYLHGSSEETKNYNLPKERRSFDTAPPGADIGADQTFAGEALPIDTLDSGEKLGTIDSVDKPVEGWSGSQ